MLIAPVNFVRFPLNHFCFSRPKQPLRSSIPTLLEFFVLLSTLLDSSLLIPGVREL
ncbi:hypothetical protein CP082626L3_1082 [Chlamydia psittaci 08-2626_L3]|nr:hypothetical protein B601_0854 [Chlamydia psittaci WS/RT/E30]EPJ32200.1 hypothetical protein CP061683_1243 [Chlamydia psittaci 06-1683]EPP28374.1 hypothetical protein CP082626L3_1082 [Chlamydia psittaci 08-2626_L3]